MKNCYFNYFFLEKLNNFLGHKFHDCHFITFKGKINDGFELKRVEFHGNDIKHTPTPLYAEIKVFTPKNPSHWPPIAIFNDPPSPKFSMVHTFKKKLHATLYPKKKVYPAKFHNISQTRKE